MDETVTDIREFDRSICDVFENQLEQKGSVLFFCKFFCDAGIRHGCFAVLSGAAVR